MSTPFERIGLSRRSVDRAGDTLRDWYLSGAPPTEGIAAAGQVLESYRQAFKQPMDEVLGELSEAVAAAGITPVQVGRRLKRQTRLVSKLARFPSMSLTRMQDLAGCRAVVSDLAGVRAVQREVERSMTVSRVIDYNVEPRASGYRALHLMVIQRGTPVEVQIRTEGQQGWAMLVEDLDSAHALALKDESGPARVAGSLALYAGDIARLDQAGESNAIESMLRAARVDLMGMARSNE